MSLIETTSSHTQTKNWGPAPPGTTIINFYAFAQHSLARDVIALSCLSVRPETFLTMIDLAEYLTHFHQTLHQRCIMGQR